MSQADIEALCEDYLNAFDPRLLNEPGELDVDRFVECYLERNLDYQHLSSDGRYLGMYVFNDTSKVVIYNQEENRAEFISAMAGTVIIDIELVNDKKNEHRYRFTMGHEAGHGIVHEEYYAYDPSQGWLFEMPDEPMIHCRKADIENSGLSNKGRKTDLEWMEWQANSISSSLLMPKPAVKVLFGPPAVSKNQIVNSNRIDEMVHVFNVSPKAAEIRLRVLGYIEKHDKIDYTATAR